MEIFEPMSDILFTYDGDVEFENGDIKLCHGLECMKRDIFKLLITSPGDWKLAPEEGASPNKFIGEQNTRDNAKKLENYLIEKIQSHITPAAVNAKVIPISRESVKVYLELNIAGLDIVNIPFTMDFINGFIYTDIDEEADIVHSSENLKYNTSDSLNHPNPIWDRMRMQ